MKLDIGQRLAEGADLLRHSIIADGMIIDEEHPKAGRLFFKCSKENKLFNASIALDSLGWRLAIASNNGIVENATLKVNDTSIKSLKKLINRAGLQIVYAQPVLEDHKPLPRILETKLAETRVKYETDPKKMGVRDVLMKVRNG